MNPMGRFFRLLTPLAILASVAVAGCTFQKADEIPLKGKRIPVLLDQRTVSADPDLKDKPFLLPAPVINPDWPEAGGYPNHAMHHLAVANVLKQAWKANIGDGASDSQRLTSTPVVAKGHVFAMDVDHHLSAYNAKNGKRLWKVDLNNNYDGDDELLPGGIAYYQNRIFVTTGFGEVVAVDAENGKVVWRQNLKSPLRAAPTVRDGRVFVVTLDSRLVTLNTKNGDTLWTYEGVGEGASVLGAASPAVEGNRVVVPLPTGELIALDIETGRLLWSDFLSGVRRTDTVSNLAQIHGNPVIDRGYVIAISHSDLMAAIDVATGQRLWEKQIGGINTPWVAGDLIYVLTNEAEVVAIQRGTGNIYWVVGLPQFTDPNDRNTLITWTGPVLAGNRLILAGSNGKALAVSPYSGKILGRIDLPDNVNVPPIVANGTVYFLADNADIVAYR